MSEESQSGPLQRIVSLHYCEVPDAWPFANYGPAAGVCWEDGDGFMWIGNGEYTTQVNYCPFCGKRAKTPVKLPLVTAS